MRLSFCPAVAFSSISRILVCSTGELGGDKHGGCLIEKSAPKNETSLSTITFSPNWFHGSTALHD